MWMKICGFTQSSNAQQAAQLGVSAIGLNFFPSSKRFVSDDLAKEIACGIRSLSLLSQPEIVGVFVNASVVDVVTSVDHAGLTAVQFHGDESVSLVSDFHRIRPQIGIIRAVRVSYDRIQRVLDSLDELIHSVPLRACLLDAFAASEYGGTGLTVDHHLIERYQEVERPRLIVAGGLTADNVSQVVSVTHPWGVDTASGVESAPGIKDPLKMAAFLQNCRAASKVSGDQTLDRL